MLQGGPKKLTPFVLYALISSNIDRFTNLFQCQNQQNICNNTVTKDSTTPQVCRYTTLWNVSVSKATIENKTTSVTTHFKNASYGSGQQGGCIEHLNYNWLTACGICQLLTLYETINTLFPVVNFLKRVATELVLFSVVFWHWHFTR